MKTGCQFQAGNWCYPRGSDQHSTGGGSEEQVIVVMDSPEMSFHGQPAMETTHLADLGEVPLTYKEVWGGGYSLRVDC